MDLFKTVFVKKCEGWVVDVNSGLGLGELGLAHTEQSPSPSYCSGLAMAHFKHMPVHVP